MLLGSHPSFEPPHPSEPWWLRLWAWLTGAALKPTLFQIAPQRALHATTKKLVQVQLQVERLQTEHYTEMARLAQAYQSLSPQARAALPASLRAQLNRIEARHNGSEP